ncbi:MAG TPA: hypothetical protein ENI26_06355 [Methylophaga aminisulfidivorans]|uniref:Uncharacterized protein n=1 Tax=Methylophaga aminisulfidivorans TaxID=230105 RepID=A0A7C1VRH3_9GAMM|nr:hypothetical protein [Methylophaga aminisulfidivorans]
MHNKQKTGAYHYVIMIWTGPILMASLSLVGLISALVGNNWYDWVGNTALTIIAIFSFIVVKNFTQPKKTT